MNRQIACEVRNRLSRLIVDSVSLFNSLAVLYFRSLRHSARIRLLVVLVIAYSRRTLRSGSNKCAALESVSRFSTAKVYICLIIRSSVGMSLLSESPHAFTVARIRRLTRGATSAPTFMNGLKPVTKLG